MTRTIVVFLLFLLVIGYLLHTTQVVQKSQAMNAQNLQGFDNAPVVIKYKNSRLDYTFHSETDKFYVYIPPNYSGQEPFGLVAFINSADDMIIPPEWASVLEQKKLLYIAPQGVGNNQDFQHRCGLTVVGILKMMEHYKIDPHRIYSAGMSGGARCAAALGFYQSDLISGAVCNCGSGFCERVPKVKSTQTDDYGFIQATPVEVADAKSKVRFAIITGPNDFRYGNLLDIFQGGYEKRNFQAKLFDVPGMGHNLCNGAALSEAITFIEAR